jgi:hypothetical protein
MYVHTTQHKKQPRQRFSTSWQNQQQYKRKKPFHMSSHELNNHQIIIPSFQRLPGQVKQTNSSLTSKSEERRPWCLEWVKIARPMLARYVSSLGSFTCFSTHVLRFGLSKFVACGFRNKDCSGERRRRPNMIDGFQGWTGKRARKMRALMYGAFLIHGRIVKQV